jgi:hypothetical protein
MASQPPTPAQLPPPPPPTPDPIPSWAQGGEARPATKSDSAPESAPSSRRARSRRRRRWRNAPPTHNLVAYLKPCARQVGQAWEDPDDHLVHIVMGPGVALRPLEGLSLTLRPSGGALPGEMTERRPSHLLVLYERQRDQRQVLGAAWRLSGGGYLLQLDPWTVLSHADGFSLSLTPKDTVHAPLAPPDAAQAVAPAGT